MFSQLIESVRLVVERLSKENQLRGLQRMTGHLGIPEPATNPGDEYVEPHRIPVRTRPAPRKGRYDPHPEDVRYAKKLEKDIASKMAKGTAGGASPRAKGSPSAKAIRALRAKRDEVTKLKKKRAAMAGRIPMKFPKEK